MALFSHEKKKKKQALEWRECWLLGESLLFVLQPLRRLVFFPSALKTGLSLGLYIRVSPRVREIGNFINEAVTSAPWTEVNCPWKVKLKHNLVDFLFLNCWVRNPRPLTTPSSKQKASLCSRREQSHVLRLNPCIYVTQIMNVISDGAHFLPTSKKKDLVAHLKGCAQIILTGV